MIGSFTATVDQTGSVTVSADDVSVPPLGAWQLDISYDAHMLTAVSCTPTSETQECNPAFALGVIRLVGVQATGLTGGSIELATITFSCDALGDSDLTIVAGNFTDTNGFEMPHLIQNGQAECTPPSFIAVDGGSESGNAEESLQNVEGGSSRPSAIWYAVGGAILAGFAVVSLGAWMAVKKTPRAGDI